MPLKPGKQNFSSNVSEFHKGKTFAKTAKKFGKKKADQQALAVSYKMARKKMGYG